MYLLQAKEKVDKEVRKKERERKKRLRQERKERKKIDSYDGLVQGWQDTTFNCGYLGSFAVAMESDSDNVDKDDVKDKLGHMQLLYEEAQPALMTICLEGIEIFNQQTQAMSMAYTLARINYMALHPEEPIVGFVAKNPGSKERFCHVFRLRKRKRAQQIHKRMRKALKIFEMEYEIGKGAAKGSKSKRSSKVCDDADGAAAKAKRRDKRASATVDDKTTAKDTPKSTDKKKTKASVKKSTKTSGKRDDKKSKKSKKSAKTSGKRAEETSDERRERKKREKERAARREERRERRKQREEERAGADVGAEVAH